MLVPVILAGGIGSRLWPLSRSALPKQFISFPQHQGSLFQETIRRLDGITDIGEPIVLCNAEHRFLAAEQLRQLGKRQLGKRQLGNRQLGNRQATILLEPVGRNTAPAVAMAALVALQEDIDASLLVLPSDQLIEDGVCFRAAINQGIGLAQQGKLITFGIVPGEPETGFGYIEQGESVSDTEAFRVSRFVEKPDRQTAQEYLASGKYLWNSGMFLFRAAVFLEELEREAPDILASCRQAFAEIKVDSDFQQIPEQSFSSCRSDSIDYAVMEKTSNAVVIPLAAGWSDLGSWGALYEADAKDSSGNVISGDVLSVGVSNSYLQSQSRLIAAVGLTDTVVVETADAVLVAARSQVQAVKQIVDQLEASGRTESSTHSLVKRPWGTYQSLAQGRGYQVKHLVVDPGQATSLQLHHHRAEHWTVVAGTGLIYCDDGEFSLAINESTFIPLGSKHRLSNPGEITLEIIEVQVGEYLGEDDIVRFDDRYGRSN